MNKANHRISAIYKASTSLVILIGIALTLFGLSHQSTSFPWSPLKGLAITVSLFGLFTAINKLLKLSILPSLIAVFGFIALLSGNLWPLLVATTFFLSSRALGGFILRTIGIENQENNYLNQVLTGAGAFGVLVGLLAHFPVSYPGLYGLMLALPLVIFRNEILKDLTLLLHNISTKTEHNRLDLLNSLIATFATIHFLYALMPELGYDALTLHLLVPSHLFSRHQWGFDPSLYCMALIPMQGEWIFSIGYMLAGETGARLLNLSFTYLMAFQGYRIASWLGGDTRSSKLTALLFLATPLTFLETNSLHVEAIWGAFILGGVMAIVPLLAKAPTNVNSHLKLGGLFFGIAANAKAITLPILPILAVLLACYFRQWFSKKALKALLMSLASFLIIGSISYVTAWIISGNPVFPFFNNVFKSPFFPLENFDNPLFNIGVTWDILYRVTFDSIKYLEATTGAPGFQWLLLLPASIIMMAFKRNVRALLLFIIAAVSLAMIFRSQSYLRYVFPLFVIFSALIATFIYQFAKEGKAYAYLCGFSCAAVILLNILFFPAATWNYRSFPAQILLSKDLKDNYLLHRAPVRLAVAAINTINRERSPVAFFTAETFGAGLTTDGLYSSWYNNQFLTEINSIKTTQDLVNVLSKYNASYLILDENWGDAEKRNIIKASSNEIANFNYVSVRQLSEKFRSR
jgi:4-amino-4-deoxy-L-arabinose transferase-like glycosyltransferase